MAVVRYACERGVVPESSERKDGRLELSSRRLASLSDIASTNGRRPSLDGVVARVVLARFGPGRGEAISKTR
eukprot:scaffold129196_cov69-Phaeocystis_antarctica.AAC.3